MFRRRQLRTLLEARINNDHRGDQAAGRLHFVNDLRAALGLMVMSPATNGRPAEFMESRDEYGRPVIAKGAVKPHEFSLRELAEAIFGDTFDRHFTPNEAPDRRTLLEAGAIDPTAFLNINTFSLATAGLIEAGIIERFQNPAFIGDQLVTVRPTRMNGEKMIGVTGIGDKAANRPIGGTHPRADFGEHWIKTPELAEKALACEVTQEAVFYDLTGQVLETANSVGEELGYAREKTIADLVLGVVNPYSYNDTTYNTYQTATPWINDHVNVPVDYTDMQASKALFRQMTDPATGKEILVMPNTILHHSDREDTFHRILNSTEVRETSDAGARLTIMPPPPSVSSNKPTLLSSPIFDNRMTAANGLALSLANAQDRWHHGDFRRAFMWMEAWPLRVKQASASEYMMIDRGIIAAYFANYRGVGAVREPRYVVRNKAA